MKKRKSFEEVDEILNSPKYKMVFNESKLTNPEPYEFEHNGVTLTAIFEGVIEEDHKGNVVLRMNIANEGNGVGYIKVFYTPSETAKEIYPDVLHWISANKGCNLSLSRHPRDMDYDDSVPWEEKSVEEKQDVIKTFYNHFQYMKSSEFSKRIENGETIDYEKKYKEINKFAEERFESEYSKFIRTLDMPIIEFSRIKKTDDRMTADSEAMEAYCKSKGVTLNQYAESDDISYRGTGLAKKMYKLMSDYLAINGMVLRKGATNDLSEIIWEHKIKKDADFNYKEINGRPVIDNRNKDLSYLKSRLNKENIIDVNQILDSKIKEQKKSLRSKKRKNNNSM